jgi:putative ABC transport system permease protein
MHESGPQRAAPLWLRLAALEIKGDGRFALSFVVSLSIGLIGFLTIDAFQRSLSAHLEGRSRSILAADVAVSASRPLTDEETATVAKSLPPGAVTRLESGLMSMVASQQATRLVEVRAVDALFPFYGALRLRKAGAVTQTTLKDVVTTRSVWVYPELLVQLQIEVGDELKIGRSVFKVTDVIDEDPSVSAIGFSIAPKVVIGHDMLEETGLLQKGSRVFRGIYVKLPGGAAATADEVAAALKVALPSKEIRIRTHRAASEELSRMLSYLNDYLGLVALVALFLAAVGAAYLFRGFLERRAKDVAILASLGAGRGLIRSVYMTQLALLGSVATALTLVLGQLLLPALPRLLAGLMPPEMELGVRPMSALLAASLGIGGSLLFCLPSLRRLDGVQPSALFQEAASPTLGLPMRQALAWLPALTVYWLLACWQAHSFRIGSLFVGLFLGSGALFAGLALVVLRLIEGRLSRIRGTPPLAPWLAGLSLSRRRPATMASFLAISLGALLIAVIPQVRAVLEYELMETPGEERPSLFLFDIQEDQVEPLKDELTRIGTAFRGISPMIRAQLEEINGAQIARQEQGMTREAEESARSQNRGYNLTYRETLLGSEMLVAGRPFSGRFDPAAGKPAEISLEQRFAERLDLEVGDRMSFDVQGVKVEGEVVSLRRVRWTSFEPNFFVQFQAGVLDEAPKTWVGALPEMSFDEKIVAQSKLVAAFPNVSIIDVSATIGRILSIVQQMGIAIFFMAALSLCAGLAVLFSIARHEADKRTRDVALLKVLGARFAQVRATVALEFAMLGLMAALAGTLLSIGVAFVLTSVLFDRLFVFDPRTPLVVLVACSALCLVTGLLATSRSLRLKPRLLLGR